MIKITAYSIVPSPYQRDLFHELSCLPEIDLTVYYLEPSHPDNPWPEKPLQPYERVLPGGDIRWGASRFHWNWHLPRLHNTDAIIFNGYQNTIAQWILRTQARSIPCIFWGERMVAGEKGIKGQLQKFFASGLNHCAVIAAIGSQATADYQRRYPGKLVVNIPYYCDLASFSKNLPERPRTPVTILFCGQMIERKGVDLLLAAFARLRQTGLEAKLLLVGREAELPQMLATMPPEVVGHIEFAGFQAPDDLPQFFQRADIFVLPSRYDGWGVVVNQALGAGLPIICSDSVGAAHDLIKPGQNGTIFPAGDREALYVELLTYLQHPDSIRRASQASTMQAKDWTPRGSTQSNFMKVLFLASYFPKPDNPVMGTWALSQAQALVRQGVDLLTLSFTSWVPSPLALTAGAQAYAHCPAEYVWPGQVVVRYPRWLYYPVPPIKQKSYINPEPYLRLTWQSARKTLIKTIEQFRPDVIFCHHSLPNGWVVANLPAALQRPLFVLEHDYGEVADCHVYPRRRAAMQQVAGAATQLMAVSRRMEQDMNILFPGVSTSTHHNGIDLPPAHLASAARPKDIQDKQVILSCALLSERKGMPLLVEAFHRIAPKHPNAVLRIVGDGPEGDRVEQTVAALNLQSQVQLLGKQPHDRVLQEMAWADGFALVGWDEPFATVYLEAMAAGKPIICCSDGGITDVVQDSVHGYTVPPRNVEAAADALDQLLSQPDQRLKMGQQARQLIEQFLTWDAQAQTLLTKFDQGVATPEAKVERLDPVESLF